MKGGSLKKTLNNLCHNQVVLYLVALLALSNLVGYVMQNNLAAIGLFLAISVGIAQTTKNMIFVLLTTVIVTHLLIKLGLFKSLGFREGLKGKKKKSENDTDTDLESDDDTDDDPSSTPPTPPTPPDPSSTPPTPSGPSGPGPSGPSGPPSGPGPSGPSGPGPSGPSSDPSGTSTKSSKKTSNNSPKKINDDPFANLNDDDLAGTGNKVNYAKTVENAFDNLDKILGSDGMKKMSADTARLANKQQNLISAMKNMQPLMSQAQDMLTSLEGGPFSGLLMGGKDNERK